MRDRPRYTEPIHTHRLRYISTHLGLIELSENPVGYINRPAAEAFTLIRNAIYNMELSIMPAKASKSQKFNVPTIFVDYILNAEQKKEYLTWVGEEKHISSAVVEQMATRGWKLSCSYDTKNKCFLASHTNRMEGDENENVCITSRAGDVWSAILINSYKVAVLFQFKKIKPDAGEDNWG